MTMAFIAVCAAALFAGLAWFISRRPEPAKPDSEEPAERRFGRLDQIPVGIKVGELLTGLAAIFLMLGIGLILASGLGGFGTTYLEGGVEIPNEQRFDS